jgi:hypothetical protein
MRAFVLLLLACLAGSAADDWAKVKALKTGSDLRVFKKGSPQPVSAQFGDLTDDNLIVIVKKTETAIPRDQIDRIDARPPSGTRITKETNSKQTVNPDGTISNSSGAGLSMGSRPDFETVYHRVPPPPKK